jgi:periplasmic protein TonB
VTSTAPNKISAPQPQYTEIARKARIQGVVIVQAIINKQGNVTDVKVLKGLPMGLDQAAVDAIRKWKFEPATLNGKPVDVYYNLTVNFTLQ